MGNPIRQNFYQVSRRTLEHNPPIEMDFEEEMKELSQEQAYLLHEETKHRKKNGWYGVDLDGTLAYYDGYSPEIGNPIPKMLKRVKKWLAEGREVRIFTARVSRRPQDSEQHVEEVRKKVEDWTELHLGQRLQVTNIKDHNLIELWDDRAVQVVKNTGKRVKWLKKRK